MAENISIGSERVWFLLSSHLMDCEDTQWHTWFVFGLSFVEAGCFLFFCCEHVNTSVVL